MTKHVLMLRSFDNVINEFLHTLFLYFKFNFIETMNHTILKHNETQSVLKTRKN